MTECRVKLAIRKKFFTTRVVRHRHRFSREVVAVLSMVGQDLEHLGIVEVAPAHGKGLDLGDPFNTTQLNSTCSRILWFYDNSTVVWCTSAYYF